MGWCAPVPAQREECQKNVRNPNHHYFSKKYRNTPPICIAIRLQFVPPYFWCPYTLRKGKYCQYSSHLYRSTPPICIAIRLPFVSQCFWENLGGCGHRNVPHLIQSEKSQKSLGATKFLSAKFGLPPPPPPEKGPKWEKTVQISGKSSKLTLFPGGGGENAILWTKRFYGHLGVSEKPRTHKNKIGTSPLPLKWGILWTWRFCCGKERRNSRV